MEAEQVVTIARTELRTLDPERLVMTLLFKGGGSLVLAEHGEKHTLAAIVRRVLAATGAGTYEQLTGARVHIRGFATDPRGLCFGIGRADGPGYYEDRGRFHACQDQLWSDRNRKSEARKKQK